jgi:hypothetical protein
VTLVLIGCAKIKADVPSPASDLYISPGFRTAWSWALNTGHPTAILSAKHGVLMPEEIVDPYDTYIKEITPSELETLVAKVRNQLSQFPARDFIVLGGEDYVNLVREACPDADIHDPLHRFKQGPRIPWLRMSNNHNWREFLALEDLYSYLRVIAGGRLEAKFIPTLGETLKGQLPEKGVYYFFEESELRHSRKELRVTRVGTHAIHNGAKSTLKSRLRTHAGSEALNGDHRTSIFRSHVGNALQSTKGVSVPTWNKYLHQLQEEDYKTREKDLELLVSKKIREMRVLVAEVSDTASPTSDRVFIEQNSIGLLSKVGRMVDPPSGNWLGNSSPADVIRDSGLWNLDDSDHDREYGFPQRLKDWIENSTILK